MTDIAPASSSNQLELRPFSIDPEFVFAQANASASDSPNSDQPTLSPVRPTAAAATATSTQPGAYFSRDALPLQVPIRERTLDNASTMSIASHGTTEPSLTPRATIGPSPATAGSDDVMANDGTQSAALGDPADTVYMEPNVPDPHKVYCDRLQMIGRTVKTVRTQYQTLADADQYVSRQNSKIRRKSLQLNNDFAQRGGLEELLNVSTEPIACHESFHTARATYIREHVLPALDQLLGEVDVRRDELKRSRDRSALSVNKERKETRRRVSLLENTVARLSRKLSPKQDPYIVNQDVLHQLDRQLTSESLFHQVTTERQQSMFAFEASVVDRMKQIVAEFLRWDAEHCGEMKSRLQNTAQPVDTISDEGDRTAFIRNRRGSLLDPHAPVLAGDQVFYKNRNSVHVQPVREGQLTYRPSGGAWSTGFFVLTPVGYLHCFPVPPTTTAPGGPTGTVTVTTGDPIFSLQLQDCEVGEYSLPISSPFSWTVTEHGKVGLVRRLSLVAINEDASGTSGYHRVITFQAGSEPELIGWWNAMSHIARGDDPQTVAASFGTAGRPESTSPTTSAEQPATRDAPPASTIAAPSLDAESKSPAQDAGQPDTLAMPTSHPLSRTHAASSTIIEESPTLPLDATVHNREASTKAAGVPLNHTSGALTPTNAFGVPVLEREVEPVPTPSNAEMPAMEVPESGTTDAEIAAATALLGADTVLNEAQQHDPHFFNYTRDLTESQRQHVAQVLLQSGSEAAHASARTFGLGEVAASAGRRRMDRHEPTWLAARQASDDTLDSTKKTWSMTVQPASSQRSSSSMMEASGIGVDESPASRCQYFKALPFANVEHLTGHHRPWGTLQRHSHHQHRPLPYVKDSHRAASQRRKLLHELPFANTSIGGSGSHRPWGTLYSHVNPHRIAKRHAHLEAKEAHQAREWLTELPFAHIEPDTEHSQLPWGTFIFHARTRHGAHYPLHGIYVDRLESVRNKLLFTILPFAGIPLDSHRKPWGTFVYHARPHHAKHAPYLFRLADSNREANQRRHLLAQLPFANTPIDGKKNQPWGTFTHRDRTTGNTLPLRMRVAEPEDPHEARERRHQLAELPFAHTSLIGHRHKPWGTFTYHEHPHRLAKQQAKRRAKKAARAARQCKQAFAELPFCHVAIWPGHQPWGTFTYQARPRHSVSKMRRAHMPTRNIDARRHSTSGTETPQPVLAGRRRSFTDLPFAQEELGPGGAKQPWGTFIYHTRPRHALSHIRRAMAVERHERAAAEAKRQAPHRTGHRRHGSAPSDTVSFSPLPFAHMKRDEPIPYGTLRARRLSESSQHRASQRSLRSTHHKWGSQWPVQPVPEYKAATSSKGKTGSASLH